MITILIAGCIISLNNIYKKSTTFRQPLDNIFLDCVKVSPNVTHFKTKIMVYLFTYRTNMWSYPGFFHFGTFGLLN